MCINTVGLKHGYNYCSTVYKHVTSQCLKTAVLSQRWKVISFNCFILCHICLQTILRRSVCTLTELFVKRFLSNKTLLSELGGSVLISRKIQWVSSRVIIHPREHSGNLDCDLGRQVRTSYLI